MNCGGFSFTPIPRVCNFFARTYRSYLEFVALHDPHVHSRAWALTASCVYIGRERTRSARVPHLISMLRCIEQVFFLLPKVYMPSVLDTSTAPPCMTRTDCAPSQSRHANHSVLAPDRRTATIRSESQSRLPRRQADRARRVCVLCASMWRLREAQHRAPCLRS